jgi:membrane associated rhomboid family serine protease/Flp pilus assembly protein TadD
VLKSADGSNRCPVCGAEQQTAPPLKHWGDIPVLAHSRSGWLNAIAVLVAINVGVFLAMVISGVSIIDPKPEQLLRWGADYGPYTLHGQYWRTITAAFVHIGIIHIGMNMWCLLYLGLLAQRLFGNLVTFCIYIITGVGASLLSLAWNPMGISAGASGAIFGIAGALITTLYSGKVGIPKEELRGVLKSVVLFAVYNLIYGMRSGIDNMGHLGGLITGLFIGIFLARSFSMERESRLHFQQIALLAVACLVLFMFVPVIKANVNVIEMDMGRKALDNSDYNSALQHFQKYTAMKPQDAEGHAMLGFTFHKLQKFDEAGQEYQRALAIKPDYPWIEVNLAIIYLNQDKAEQAVPLFQRALPSYDPPDADLFRDYGEALRLTGKYTEAETALRRSISLDEKDAEAHRELAKVLAAEGKADQGWQEEKRAAELEQSDKSTKHE